MCGGVKGVTCYSVRVVRKDSQGRQHLSRDLKEVREVAVWSWGWGRAFLAAEAASAKALRSGHVPGRVRRPVWLGRSK